MNKKCSSCKDIKSLFEFYKDKNKSSGYGNNCKDCAKKIAKEWREKNPERFKQSLKNNYLSNRESRLESAKKWRDENKDAKRENNRKRKSLLKNVTHEFFTEKQVLEIYGEICHICSVAINMEAPRSSGTPGWELGLHMDHVIPISKGGSNTIENVKPSHGICNLTKNNNVIE